MPEGGECEGGIDMDEKRGNLEFEWIRGSEVNLEG